MRRSRTPEEAAEREIRLAKARARRRPRKKLEDEAQKAFVKWARGVPAWKCVHVPNELGRSRNYARANWLKLMGLEKGASDILLFTPDGHFCLEFKAPGERASADQERFLRDMSLLGLRCKVVYTASEAKEFVGLFTRIC